MNKSSGAVCWLNGEIMPASRASIPVLDHGLLYGDGVFEGIRFYDRTPFYLQAHLDRLRDSASAICLDIPLNDDQLAEAIRNLIQSFTDNDGYIRLVITRGVGSLGISPDSCKQPNVFMIADQMSMVSNEAREQGVRTITASTRRLAVDGLNPRIKSLNYLNHIMARLEAKNANAEEAIVLNANGYVTEGTTDNVFVVKKGVLLTPPVTDGALAGITRQIILDLAARLNIPYREQSLTTYDIYAADECFLTGTGAELIPVKELDGRRIRLCPGAIYGQLATAFEQLIRRANK